MGDLSTHFSRWEFECPCGCGLDTVDYSLLAVLEDIRGHFDKPVTVTSGHRCEDYNTAVSGAGRSQHLWGRAADITVLGVNPQSVYAYLVLRYPGCYGLGDGSSFTHVDTRTDGPARWDYR